MGFPGTSAGKESACNAGDPSLISGSGKSAGEGVGYPLQYSGLENSMNCIEHGVTKQWTRLSDSHFQAMFSKLGILAAFATYNIFNLRWIHWGISPL